MNLIGPTLGVQLLDRAYQHTGVSRDVAAAPVDQLVARAAACDALIDMVQANHDRLYSRLFRS